MLAGGGADLVSLGSGALAAADWPEIVRGGRMPPAFDKDMLFPIADLANADRCRAAAGRE